MPKNNPSKLAHLTMPDFKGSWWKYSDSNTTTMPIGKWVPVRVQEVPAKSLLKVKPNIRFESMPMVSPLYNGFTMRTKFYFFPIRLIVPELRRNKQLLWGAIPDLELPYLRISSQFVTPETGDTRPLPISLAGSLLDRLNMCYGDMVTMQSFNNPSYLPRPTGNAGGLSYGMRTNLVPLLAYYSCWLYGEYNPQDPDILVDSDSIDFSDGVISHQQRSSSLTLKYDKLRDFVDYFAGWDSTDIRNWGFEDDRFNVGITLDVLDFERLFYPLFTVVRGYNLYDYVSSFEDNWDICKNLTSTVGLLPLTYKGNYFTSWYSEEGINILKNYVVSQGESFLSMRKKNADFLVDALALVSGNRYTDYLQYIFDTNLELKDHPIMVGFDEIDFGSIDVVSQSQTGEGQNGVLAATASKARMYNSSVKNISFKTLEPGLLMVCSGIIPNVVYYQGVPRFMKKKHFADLWHPQYDSKGFQTIAQDEYYNPYSSTSVDVVDFEVSDMSYDFDLTTWGQVVSYVPLGWEYMQSFDTISGGMKTTRYLTWNLRRDYTYYNVHTNYVPHSTSYVDFINPLDDFTQVAPELLRTTYVDGISANYPFENSRGLDNDNFVVKYSFEISQYMPISHQLITKTF